MTQTFAITPADIKWLWLVGAIPIVVMIVLFAVLGASIRGARNAEFEVSPDGLRLRGDLYGRLIPAGELRAAEARRVDFAREPGLTPRRRTMGTGLRRYQSGWFRLENGERALLYLTDRSRAVYVPTNAGYSVLLSPTDPDGFVAALRGVPRQP